MKLRKIRIVADKEDVKERIIYYEEIDKGTTTNGR